MKRFILILALLLAGFTGILGQFILPEKSFTTQKDVDVIRVDSGGDELVKEIRTRVRRLRKEIMLAWTLARREQELAVVRHTQPMNNMKVLLEGELVAIIAADQTSYIDKPEKPGEYYYAIVIHKELQEHIAVLIADDNYTTNPAVLLEKEEDEVETSAGKITSIQSILIAEKLIRVEWEGQFKEGATVQVYRAEEMIDTKEKLGSAKRLASLPGNKTGYDDNEITPGKTYFYAIALRDEDGKETIELRAKRSYTTTGAGIVIKKEEIPIIARLQVIYGPDRTLILHWQDPETITPGLQFFIYRSKLPILNMPSLESAEKVGTVKPGGLQFIDRTPAKAKVYYAVISVNSAGKLSKDFMVDENTLSKPVRLEKETETESDTTTKVDKTNDNQKGNVIEVVPETQEHFFNMQAHVQPNKVVLTWDQVYQDEEEYDSNLILVYRFRKRPRELKDLMYGALLGKIPDTKMGFVDIPPSSGIYYYALFLETRKGIKPKLFIVDENLVGPVVFNSQIAGHEKTDNQEKIVKDEPGLEKGDPGIYYPDLENGDEPVKIEKDDKNNKVDNTDKADKADKTDKVDKIDNNFTKDNEQSHTSKEDNTQQENTANETERLEKVLNNTYKKGKYQLAMEELKPFHASADERVMSKSMFYSALSAYQMEEFETALKLLLHPSVRKNFGKRADFWYNRTLERME
ncbi:MAG: hypothetical protein ABUK01_10740 [Leptospirales bacterium]